MKCLNCKAKITAENKQTFKKGWGWLPYCKDCTDAYNADEEEAEEQLREVLQASVSTKTAKKLKRMTPQQRQAVKEKLLKDGHKEEDINLAWQAMGISDSPE